MYNVEKQNLYDDLQNGDYMMVWDTSVGQLCKVTGQDARNFLFPTYDVEFLNIAGGGASGDYHFTGSATAPGGGGAGGMVEGLITVTASWTATIVVGAGGIQSTTNNGLQGGDVVSAH